MTATDPIDLLLVGSVGWHLRGLSGAPGEGDSDDRITVLHRDRVSGVIGPIICSVPVAAPGFLVGDQAAKHVYAVNDLSPGRTSAFCIAPTGSLTPLNDQASGGSSPCHLMVDEVGRHVLTANYGDGAIGVHRLETDGSLGPLLQVIAHSGSGPNKLRQQSPHIHMITAESAGSPIFAVDLGTDQVVPYAFNHAGRLTPRGAPVQITRGSGARHMVFGRNGMAYVGNELASTVTVLDFDESADEFRPSLEFSSLLAEPREDDGAPSAVIIAPDRRFLYVANRRRDTVAAFDLSGDLLRPLGEYPCGGATPRDMTLADGYLYISNASSQTVTVLRQNPDTGALGPLIQRSSVAGASSLLAMTAPVENQQPAAD
jgi:6-phosphogluconolactonase